MRPAGRRLETVYEFESGRGPGELDTLVFARSLTAAEKTELNAHVESMRHCAGEGSPSEGGCVVEMVPRA